jgi:uncharacterized membrane protein YphA (DoxX/SURF4 family)
MELSIEAAAMVTERTTEAHWSLARRVGFRFLFCYFFLFVLGGQEIGAIPLSEPLVEKYTAFWYAIAVWVGRHIFQITREFPMSGDGSGDTTFQWILLPCYLALAALATLVWSLLDRRRADYERLHQWFRLLLRFSLAVAMIVYGITKAIPNQMPFPRSFTLLQRVGDLSPMRLLWTFMGASPAYETFTGLAELLGGVLLLVPRTTLLGALICVADMTMVFMLNMCYDVPVKIMSFHYLLMGIILVAPDLRRLADLFLFNRPVQPAVTTPLFERKRLDRAVQVLFFLFGLYGIGASLVEARERYERQNPPKPPLAGVWNVEEITIDGQKVSRLVDPDLWRSVTFEKPGAMSVESLRGSRTGYAVKLDLAAKKMALKKYQRDAENKPVLTAAGIPLKVPGWQAELSFHEPKAGVLVLDGDLDGHRLHAELHKMALIGRRFRWVLDPADWE